MVENRWQIIIGAVMLLLILLTGAFSLGVYIGRHGLSPEGLRYQPSQPDGMPEPLPADRRWNLQFGEPDLIGLIRDISPQGIQLATQEGPRLLETNDATRVFDTVGQLLKLADLRLGDIVAVFGDFTPGDGRHLLAAHIVRIPPRQPPQP